MNLDEYIEALEHSLPQKDLIAFEFYGVLILGFHGGSTLACDPNGGPAIFTERSGAQAFLDERRVKLPVDARVVKLEIKLIN